MKSNQKTTHGYVYIMTNYFYGNLIKIGQTQNRPDVRANELNRQTGVLGDFIVEWYAEVSNCKIAEQLIHLLFDNYRVAKEFFHIDLEESIIIMENKLTSVFTNENVKSHRPPKPLLKLRSDKELQIKDILNLSRHNFTDIQPSESENYQQKVNDLRYKLLYRPEIYFKEIKKELEEYCLNFNQKKIDQSDTIIETKTIGYVYFPLNNSFSKWLHKQDDILVKDTIFEERREISDESETDFYEEEVCFSIIIPFNNFDLCSVYAEGFIEILRRHGIFCNYKISDLDASVETVASVYCDDETNIWYFKTSQKTYNLNKILDDDVFEAYFLDKNKKDIVIVGYSNWESNELIAIINKSGKIIYKGIMSIESYIADHDLFILIINSEQVQEDLYHYHGLKTDEQYYFVINIHGEMIIEFTEDCIKYDEEEIGFYIRNSEELFKI